MDAIKAKALIRASLGYLDELEFQTNWSYFAHTTTVEDVHEYRLRAWQFLRENGVKD